MSETFKMNAYLEIMTPTAKLVISVERLAESENGTFLKRKLIIA